MLHQTLPLPLAVALGGTEAATAAGARANLGLRQPLAANTTYYVSDSAGSDTTGDGSSGAPWKTIQKAINHVSGLDCGTYDVTISVAAGTYAPFTLKSFLGSGMAKVQGDVSTPTNVVVSSTSGPAVAGTAVQGTWTIAGLKITTSGSGSHGIYLFGAPGNLTIDRCRFSACVSSHIVALSGAVIFLLDYSIDGSTGTASYHAYAAGGSIRCDARTITGSGSPAFGNGTTGGFAYADRAGLVYWVGATFTGFGSAAGRRYYASLCGVLMTGGTGGSFPGNVAGSVDPTTYGVYQ